MFETNIRHLLYLDLGYRIRSAKVERMPLKAVMASLVILGISLSSCGGSGASSALSKSPMSSEVTATTEAAATTGSPSRSSSTTEASASSAPPCTLVTTFDYIVRTAIPGLPPDAVDIGNVNLEDCTETLKDFQVTAAQGKGDCTQIALASDNPGYDVNAPDPPPLKHVIDQVGPGCQ